MDEAGEIQELTLSRLHLQVSLSSLSPKLSLGRALTKD